MKKKILIPTDFSKNAWSAIAYASALYKDKNVDFYLLNTFSVNTFILESLMAPEPGEPLYEEAKEKSLLGLDKLLADIKEKLDVNPNHNYYTESIFNSPIAAIKNCIEAKDIELVIASNKGETNDLDTVMGSNAVEMMENVRNCPVLMIPSNIAFKVPNEIVFPTSFKTHFKRRELAHLIEIAKITNTPVRVLHVNKEDQLSKEQIEKKALLEECLEGISYSFHYLEDTDIKNGLKLFVQSRESEMIVFINKKHAFFDSVFTKPMVKDLGYNAKVPVLTLHDLRN